MPWLSSAVSMAYGGAALCAAGWQGQQAEDVQPEVQPISKIEYKRARTARVPGTTAARIANRDTSWEPLVLLSGRAKRMARSPRQQQQNQS